MGLETGTYINDLNVANPVGSTDPKSELDNHLRLVKSTLKATFPGMAGRAWRVQTKAAPYTLTANDNMTQITVTAAANISATAGTLGNGFVCLIYNLHTAAITIPGGISLAQYGAVLLNCNGSGFSVFPFANGVVIGTSDTQTSYNTSALISQSNAGHAGIGLHAIGSSAIWIEHTRGTRNLRIKDSTGVNADFICSLVVQTSDKRLKRHIAEVGDSGKVIDALRPVKFQWKMSGKVDLGFYAQDVSSLVPEACIEPDDNNEHWGFKPDRLIPLLVREIQSLRRRVEELERR